MSLDTRKNFDFARKSVLNMCNLQAAYNKIEGVVNGIEVICEYIRQHSKSIALGERLHITGTNYTPKAEKLSMQGDFFVQTNTEEAIVSFFNEVFGFTYEKVCDNTFIMYNAKYDRGGLFDFLQLFSYRMSIPSLLTEGFFEKIYKAIIEERSFKYFLLGEVSITNNNKNGFIVRCHLKFSEGYNNNKALSGEIALGSKEFAVVKWMFRNILYNIAHLEKKNEKFYKIVPTDKLKKELFDLIFGE